MLTIVIHRVRTLHFLVHVRGLLDRSLVQGHELSAYKLVRWNDKSVPVCCRPRMLQTRAHTHNITHTYTHIYTYTHIKDTVLGVEKRTVNQWGVRP